MKSGFFCNADLVARTERRRYHISISGTLKIEVDLDVEVICTSGINRQRSQYTLGLFLALSGYDPCHAQRTNSGYHRVGG